MSARRTLRLFIVMLVALGAAWLAGREFGLGNDELLDYLLLSGAMVIASGVVGFLLFGIIRLFRRS